MLNNGRSYKIDRRYVMNRASSILWNVDFHATLQNLPFAVEFAACCRKRGTARFLLHLHLIQRFSGSFLTLPFIKQNLVLVSYSSVLLPLRQSLTQNNLQVSK